MSNATTKTDAGPVLRTLSPALRGVERNLRAWLDGPHPYPLSLLHRSALDGVAKDLGRQADALDVDRPLLVVMLMGGTGVGKSSLMNAIAGDVIGDMSIVRPTTCDPIIYCHESIRPDRLDKALLSQCRLVHHDRKELEHKVLVDTPDVDGNLISNHEKLLQILPIADVVLYVASQEKYIDAAVFRIFREQRKRRAFAFVLNKWDRCMQHSDTGLRPDEHLLHKLQSEGFTSPRLFRTCADRWVERASGANGQPELPEGEQFRDLLGWLETGLTRLEIEAIKARGVSQLLDHTGQALEDAAPPNLTDLAGRVRAAWAKPLAEEARVTAEILVNTLEPHHREIEYHFALEGQRRFRGLMAWYLQLVTRTRHVGTSIGQMLPFGWRTGGAKADTPGRWNPSYVLVDATRNLQLNPRAKALIDHLLVEAEKQSFPLSVLTGPVEGTAQINWQQRWERALADVLTSVEQQWTRPTGTRRLIQGTIVLLADWLPPVALLMSLVYLLYQVFYLNHWQWLHVFMPGIVLVVVFLILHLLIHLLLPLRWNAIRDTFHRELETRIRQELESVFLDIPPDVAKQLLAERRVVEQLQSEAGEVAAWLKDREQSAVIEGLYGN